MNEHYFKETKGQSAIEYLMTYGWMLLVVAIVGGAIFATVQGQCAQSASGFSGQDVQVENFGVSGTDDELQMELRNGGSSSITLNSVEVGSQTNDTIEDEDAELPVGSTTTVSVDGFESSDGCNDFNVEFNYDYSDESLTDLQTSGSLTDSIQEN